MQITEIKKKVGRPIGSVTKTKTILIVVDRKVLTLLETHQAYLSDLYRCQLTLNQTAEHILKTSLETT
jgi:hypothetical protein